MWTLRERLKRGNKYKPRPFDILPITGQRIWEVQLGAQSCTCDLDVVYHCSVDAS